MRALLAAGFLLGAAGVAFVVREDMSDGVYRIEYAELDTEFERGVIHHVDRHIGGQGHLEPRDNCLLPEERARDRDERENQQQQDTKTYPESLDEGDEATKPVQTQNDNVLQERCLTPEERALIQTEENRKNNLTREMEYGRIDDDDIANSTGRLHRRGGCGGGGGGGCKSSPEAIKASAKATSGGGGGSHDADRAEMENPLVEDYGPPSSPRPDEHPLAKGPGIVRGPLRPSVPFTYDKMECTVQVPVLPVASYREARDALLRYCDTLQGINPLTRQVFFAKRGDAVVFACNTHRTRVNRCFRSEYMWIEPNVFDRECGELHPGYVIDRKTARGYGRVWAGEAICQGTTINEGRWKGQPELGVKETPEGAEEPAWLNEPPKAHFFHPDGREPNRNTTLVVDPSIPFGLVETKIVDPSLSGPLQQPVQGQPAQGQPVQGQPAQGGQVVVPPEQLQGTGGTQQVNGRLLHDQSQQPGTVWDYSRQPGVVGTGAPAQDSGATIPNYVPVYQANTGTISLMPVFHEPVEGEQPSVGGVQPEQIVDQAASAQVLPYAPDPNVVGTGALPQQPAVEGTMVETAPQQQQQQQQQQQPETPDTGSPESAATPEQPSIPTIAPQAPFQGTSSEPLDSAGLPDDSPGAEPRADTKNTGTDDTDVGEHALKPLEAQPGVEPLKETTEKGPEFAPQPPEATKDESLLNLGAEPRQMIGSNTLDSVDDLLDMPHPEPTEDVLYPQDEKVADEESYNPQLMDQNDLAPEDEGDWIDTEDPPETELAPPEDEDGSDPTEAAEQPETTASPESDGTQPDEELPKERKFEKSEPFIEDVGEKPAWGPLID